MECHCMSADNYKLEPVDLTLPQNITMVPSMLSAHKVGRLYCIRSWVRQKNAKAPFN